MAQLVPQHPHSRDGDLLCRFSNELDLAFVPAHHSDPVRVSGFLHHCCAAPSSHILLCSDFLLDRLPDVCHLNFVLFPFFHSGCIDSAEQGVREGRGCRGAADARVGEMPAPALVELRRHTHVVR